MKVAVIGGGPSGIIASGFAGSRGLDVTLFERNNILGKKLFITGNGRCNITNYCSVENFFDNVVNNSSFLYSSFYSFSNEDIITLIEKYGVRLKVEKGNRVFPASDKSRDVIRAFEKFLKDNKVNIKLNTKIDDVKYDNNKFILISENGTKYSFDRLIISTGGKTYPVTGSTGDGYYFAKKFGHTVVPLKPSLVPMEIKEDWVKKLKGLSLKNVSLKAFINNKKAYEEFGEMLFTHYGISGPIVLSLSSRINKYDNKNIKFKIDLKPELSNKKLEEIILKNFQLNNNKQIKNSLNELLPKKLVPIIIKLSSIDQAKPINQINVKERKRIVKTIKNLPLTFKKFRPIEEAIVTSGGVSTKEINPSTMESKLIPGLFFTGEVIDVDALTGGFNLQIAYSTGYLAGMNV